MSTFREWRLVTRGRLRNKWQRWRHRGSLPPWGSNPDGYAASLHEHCRTQRPECLWCGRGIKANRFGERIR